MDMSQPKKGDDLNINKGIELMLRRAKPKDSSLKPKSGFSAEGLLDIGELHNTVQSLQEA